MAITTLPHQATSATTSTTPAVDKKVVRRKRFEEAWVVIRDELLEQVEKQGLPKDACEWYKRNLDYNVPGGKLNRGMSVVDSIEILRARPLSDEEYFKAAVLGWCVEFLQAYFLVTDDIMDGSLVRRSQPCWYRIPTVGSIAINDAYMLGGAIYQLLKIHFRSESYYVDLVELFHESSYQTEMGQLIDLITAPEDSVDLNKFSLDRHQQIVIFKTAYYSFYLPVALAMLVTGIPTSYAPASSPSTTIHPYTLAQSILLPLGEYFQVQDDWLDYSGTVEAIGKVGTDIIDNKCSWCVNTALALANEEQRRVLDENYGRKGAEQEGRVKKVFEEVGLAERYRDYEERAYQRIGGLIETIPERACEGELKREVFRSFLDKIYGRSK